HRRQHAVEALAGLERQRDRTPQSQAHPARLMSPESAERGVANARGIEPETDHPGDNSFDLEGAPAIGRADRARQAAAAAAGREQLVGLDEAVGSGGKLRTFLVGIRGRLADRLWGLLVRARG